MPEVTLDHIIAIANEAYEDDLVLDYHRGEERFDTLAKFIAIELKETFDENIPYHMAAAAMQRALTELTRVRDSLESGVRPTPPASLEDALETWQVHAPGTWENDHGPSGWWAVSNDDGIVAYFGNERDACRYRLDRVNHALNG